MAEMKTMANVDSNEVKVEAVAKLCLPHPYLTTYFALPHGEASKGLRSLKIIHTPQVDGQELPEQLHNEKISFNTLQTPKNSLPAPSNNTAWARARRSHWTIITWTDDAVPTQGQLWLIVYMLLTHTPDQEYFRVQLQGLGSDNIVPELLRTSLFTRHPLPDATREEAMSTEGQNELLVSRGAFWQGAGTPLGLRSIWLPESQGVLHESVDYILTSKFPGQKVHAHHPRRPAKPRPGSVVYSRYIPSLDEHFSMIALDYENSEHLDLFHTWQNDPRVAQGWNETGTLDEHRTYLRNLHEDPHVVTVLARFGDVPYAYFELYWAKEDHLGAYYQAEPFDRGRHALVGNPNFRGRHRVTAWWSATMHYLFLDDARTDRIVGEPKFTNSSVLAYDLMHGFSVQKFVDLPHKRSALMMCSRERFFQICPIDHEGGFVGGTRIPLPAKL